MKPAAKAFLGKRRIATREAFERHARTEISEWQALQIKTALGMRFRQTSRVAIVRPLWMPGFLYRRLLRSIVIETRELEAR